MGDHGGGQHDWAVVTDRLEREIPELLTEHRIPGLAVGLCDSSGVRWSRGFGVTRTGGTQPVTTDTMFSVQSCSKMYTAATVLVAVQQGRLDLDAPITDYLPDFTVHSTFETHPERRLTLRHLLSHTAGFTHEAPVGGNFLIGNASFTAHCRSIADTWLRFGVGHHYEYSNLGIDLAAYTLQRVSGLRFERFAQLNLLEPMGLHRTTFDQRAIATDPDHAMGCEPGVKRARQRIPLVASGGVYASIDDACRFVSAHLAGTVGGLEPGLLAEVHRVPFAAPGQTYGYGLGLVQMDVDGIRLRGHSGGGFGFLCDLYWAPAADVGVVVLTNSEDHTLQWKLASDLMRELVPSAPLPPAALPPEFGAAADAAHHAAGEYAGRFDLTTLAVTHTDPVLTQYGAEHRVRFVSADEFVKIERPQERYRLREADEHGRPRYLQAVADGTTWYRNDVPDPVPSGRTDGVWNRDYAIRLSGSRVGSTRLRRAGDRAVIDDRMGRTLRLDRIDDGHYLSSTGEMLDLTREPITYANIRLHPVD